MFAHPFVQALTAPHTNFNDAIRDIAAFRGQAFSLNEWRGIVDVIERSTLDRANEVRELAKARGIKVGLAKAGEEAGTLYQGQAFIPGQGSTTDAGNMAPLVPQSMDGRLVDTTIKPDQAWLWKFLPKNPVYGLFHEQAVMTGATNRPYQNQFIAEGGDGSTSVGQFARRGVTIRFEAQRDFVSDVMMLLNVSTPSGFVPRAAMEIAKKRALQNLILLREQNLWLASSACDSLAYNGFYTAVGGAAVNSSTGILSFGGGTNQVLDLRGAPLSFAAIQKVCETKKTPFSGQASEIRRVVMLPRAYAALAQEAQANIRYAGGTTNVGGTIVQWYPGKLSILASYGEVAIESASLMLGQTQRNPSAAAGGTGAPTFSGTLTPTAASNASSQFTSADAGTYYYRLTAIGRNFESIPKASVAVTVAAGDAVTIPIGALASSEADVLYYMVERTPKDASSVDTSTFLWVWPKNTVNSGTSTSIIDTNAAIAQTSPVAFFTDNSDGFNEWESLLPSFFKPLAQTGTTAPFLMLDFGSPFWKAPELQFMIANAGFPS